MLDCGIEQNTLLQHEPIPSLHDTKKRKIIADQCDDKWELNVHIPSFANFDQSQVDVVLISNPWSLLALPQLTTRDGFRAQIFATEPTIQLGKKQLEELAYFSVQLSQHKEDSSFTVDALSQQKRQKQVDDNQSGSNSEALHREWIKKTATLVKTCNLQEIEECIQKVKGVSFRQPIALFGATLQAIAVSSGYSLGSANWILQTPSEKIVYLATSSANSLRHPEPLELEMLKDAQVAIVTNLNQFSTHQTSNAISTDTMINELCRAIGVTVSNGGDVLIPVSSSGLIYDLIEYIRSYLNSINLHTTNMYVVSPVADHALAYANISAEWLSPVRQQKAYVPEPPFQHMQYLKNRQLQVFSSVQQFSITYHASRMHPCIVFCGHASLRFGNVLHLIKLFDQNEKNAMILVEPGYDMEDLLKPFQKQLTMQVIPRIVDLRLNVQELAHLMKEYIKPQIMLIPRQSEKVLLGNISPSIFDFVKKEDSGSTPPNVKKANSAFSFVPHIDVFEHLTSLNVKVKTKFENASLSEDIAKELLPRKMRGANVSRVSAIMDSKDGTYVLSSAHGKDTRAVEPGEQENQLLFGEVSVHSILKSLQQRGYDDLKLSEPEYGVFQIEIPAIHAVIHYCAQETRIELQSEHIPPSKHAMVRQELKQAIIENFYVI